MNTHSALRCFVVVLALLWLAACTPFPTAPPAATQDPTRIFLAARATLTAMAPQPPTATAVAPTAPAAPQAADFWVVYLARNKLAAIHSLTEQTVLLTNTPGIDHQPDWSPDGSMLAFIRSDGSSLVEGSLQVLPAGSAAPRILNEGSLYHNFAWTPDSQHLLAVQGNYGALKVDLFDLSGQPGLRVAEKVSELPRLSPNGQQIALLISKEIDCAGMGCEQPNDLYLYDIASRQTTRLTQDEQPKVGLYWSPDGRQIAYFTTGSLADVVQPDGQRVAAGQPAPWWATQWERSPDGAQIAFFKNDAANFATEIHTIAGDGSGEPRLITRIEKFGETNPYIDTLRWRPDGSGFVFNLWTGLYTIHLNGGGMRLLPVTLENVFFDVRPTLDAYTPPPEPTAPAAWKLCRGGPDSRLDVGRLAQVATDPPAANNVRSGPNRSASLVGQIQPGEKIEITGGPVCEDGLTWWQIRSLDTGLQGYTLEGDLQTYWLVPLP